MELNSQAKKLNLTNVPEYSTHRSEKTMQQEILNNQNKILNEQHNMLKDQQSTMQHLISQSAPGDKIEKIKDELKQQTVDFQNTFYSQTYNMVNNFNDHLVKFQTLNDEFAK